MRSAVWCLLYKIKISVVFLPYNFREGKKYVLYTFPYWLGNNNEAYKLPMLLTCYASSFYTLFYLFFSVFFWLMNNSLNKNRKFSLYLHAMRYHILDHIIMMKKSNKQLGWVMFFTFSRLCYWTCRIFHLIYIETLKFIENFYLIDNNTSIRWKIHWHYEWILR